MPMEAVTISNLLCRALSEEEFSYLKGREEFSTALDAAKTEADLEVLWEIAERLLTEQDKNLQANPFRRG